MSPLEIIWSDALSMHNSEIDAQHQHFIKLVNDLNGVNMKQPLEKDEILRILGLIIDDAIAHFSYEEQLLRVKEYPLLQEHVQSHTELMSSFDQAKTEIENTSIRAAWSKAGLDIKDKLVKHLLEEDTKFIEYLRSG